MADEIDTQAGTAVAEAPAEQVEKLDQTFTGFEKVEDALWKNVRD